MKRAVRAVSRLLACIGLLLVIVSAIPPGYYGGFLAGPWTEANQGVLVVLGGDSLNTGSLGEGSFWRCVFAVDIWSESHFHHLVVTGDRTTTAAMRDYLLWRGIPSEALIVENASTSTHDNAVNTARLLSGNTEPVVLLTSDFHMYRAHRTFEKAGLHVTPRFCPDMLKRESDWRDRWRLFLDVTTEFGKIGYYRVRGWI
jgi:uncharacterized SAM-binding protein YcdF (DUF218 family)